MLDHVMITAHATNGYETWSHFTQVNVTFPHSIHNIIAVVHNYTLCNYVHGTNSISMIPQFHFRVFAKNNNNYTHNFWNIYHLVNSSNLLFFSRKSEPTQFGITLFLPLNNKSFFSQMLFSLLVTSYTGHKIVCVYK